VKEEFCNSSGWTPACGSCLDVTAIPTTDGPTLGRASCPSTTYDNSILMIVRNDAQLLYLKDQTQSAIWVALEKDGSQWQWINTASLAVVQNVANDNQWWSSDSHHTTSANNCGYMSPTGLVDSSCTTGVGYAYACERCKQNKCYL
jgi:hypothetical protein